MSNSALLVLSMLALACCGIGVLITQWKWLVLLRDRHASEWRALDSPKLLGSSIGTQWRLFRFVRTGEYRKLGDGEFTRATQLMIRWSVLYITLFLAIAVLLAYIL